MNKIKSFRSRCSCGDAGYGAGFSKNSDPRKSPRLYAAMAEISEDCKTASLGQVHRVKLLNGEELAVKIQYLGVTKDLETILEIKNLATRGCFMIMAPT
jgi:hypothetical protein